MQSIAPALLVFGTVLILAGLIQPASRRLGLPHAVLLAVLGIAIGVVRLIAIEAEPGSILGDMDAVVVSLDLDAETILYLFLPILLFEAGLVIDVRRMIDELAPILLLAIVAVVLCSLVVGFGLSAVSSYPLAVCLLLGAIIATTDPAAVIGIFRDVGAPKRLSILVEGESLFNDAAAIALYVVLLAAVIGGGALEFGQAAGDFLWTFLAGGIFGLAATRIALLALRILHGLPLAEISFSVALPYVIFVLAQDHLHVSGIVAVAVSALVFGSSGRVRITPSTWPLLTSVWTQLGYWASTLIFIVGSMAVPEFLRLATPGDAVLLLVVIVAAFAARAIVLWGLLPLLTWARVSAEVPNRFRTVVFWGGLRGAVTLTLALGVTELAEVPDEAKRIVAILATGFVLFTLMVNGTTLRPLIRALKLHHLSPDEQAIRDSAMSFVRDGLVRSVREQANALGLSADAIADVETQVVRRLGIDSRDAAASVLGAEERLRVALQSLAIVELSFYLQSLADGSVSRRSAAALVAKAGRLRDAAKTGGAEGYLRASGDTAMFRATYRLANHLHRLTGSDAWLATKIADSFEMLIVSRLALRHMLRQMGHRIRPVVGAETAGAAEAAVRTRLDGCDAALEALRLQYPTYEEVLERHFLDRLSLRMEESGYSTLLQDGLVDSDLYEKLLSRVSGEERSLNTRPPLDLGMNVHELVTRVPMFAELPPHRVAELERLLRPRYAFPGQIILREGDAGDEMYFISSGAVEVRRGGVRIRLGNGQFFGEMALLDARPRNATVVAIAHSRLLALSQRDFRRLLDRSEALRDHIRSVAASRVSVD